MTLNNSKLPQLLCASLLILVSPASNASLQSRAGGQAYYDDVLDITWLADANLAASNAFGVPGILSSGAMTWDTANEWITAMNAAAYLGTSDWRLPTVNRVTNDWCIYAYTGSDCGYNVNLNNSEMAHMFYSTLGNTGYYDTSGVATGCSPIWPRCLTNHGPFSNLGSYSWSGTEIAALDGAWYFEFDDGSQDLFRKASLLAAWAVSPGDTVVPLPGAAWLIGSALGLLGLARRTRYAA